MADQFINCPRCLTRIQLTEAFTHELQQELRAEFADLSRRKEQEYEELLKSKEKEAQERMALERSLIEVDARRRAEESLSVELQGLKSQLEDRSNELQKAREQELSLRRQRRELEERQKNLELEVSRQIDEERKKIWEAPQRSLPTNIASGTLRRKNSSSRCEDRSKS